MKADVKRKPAAPREGLVLENVKMTVRCARRALCCLALSGGPADACALQTVTAIPYDIVREGIKY